MHSRIEELFEQVFQREGINSKFFENQLSVQLGLASNVYFGRNDSITIYEETTRKTGTTQVNYLKTTNNPMVLKEVYDLETKHVFGSHTGIDFITKTTKREIELTEEEIKTLTDSLYLADTRSLLEVLDSFEGETVLEKVGAYCNTKETVQFKSYASMFPILCHFDSVEDLISVGGNINSGLFLYAKLALLQNLTVSPPIYKGMLISKFSAEVKVRLFDKVCYPINYGQIMEIAVEVEELAPNTKVNLVEIKKNFLDNLEKTLKVINSYLCGLVEGQLLLSSKFGNALVGQLLQYKEQNGRWLPLRYILKGEGSKIYQFPVSWVLVPDDYPKPPAFLIEDVGESKKEPVVLMQGANITHIELNSQMEGFFGGSIYAEFQEDGFLGYYLDLLKDSGVQFVKKETGPIKNANFSIARDFTQVIDCFTLLSRKIPVYDAGRFDYVGYNELLAKEIKIKKTGDIIRRKGSIKREIELHDTLKIEGIFRSPESLKELGYRQFLLQKVKPEQLQKPIRLG